MTSIYKSDTGNAIAVEYNGKFYPFAVFVLDEASIIVPHRFPDLPSVFEGFFEEEGENATSYADSLAGVAELDPQRVGFVHKEDLVFTKDPEVSKIY